MPEGNFDQRKIRSINVRNLERFFDDETLEKLKECRIVYIVDKKKVIAHAKWQNGDLVVTKIRRPQKSKNVYRPELRVGDVLYEEYRFAKTEIPPRPEILSEGWQLVRNTNYDSSRAKRIDPYWNDYTGWFIIPQTVNDKPALEEFLRDYPELQGDEQRPPSYEVLPAKTLDQSRLKMARFSDVDSYVIGDSDKIPELQPFRVPPTENMVQYTAALCMCGCGKFEGWYRYWENEWIVYVPREKPLETKADDQETE